MVEIKVKGGEKIAAVLEEMAGRFRNASTLKVGFFEGATYPDGTPLAAVAAYNEFGTKTQPPRPFFRQAVADNSAKWPVNLATAMKTTKGDARRSLSLLGTEIKDEIQKSIRDFTSPPLSEVTIKKKGFDKPLIETSFMLKNVKFTVE